jgi:hypothetical protein
LQVTLEVLLATKVEIDVKKLYDLTQPGDMIEVERFDPATRTLVKSNAISITVAP